MDKSAKRQSAHLLEVSLNKFVDAQASHFKYALIKKGVYFYALSKIFLKKILLLMCHPIIS